MLTIGIIGLGDIAQKAYLPVITQLADVEPVFCTRNRETLEALAQQYRVDKYCVDYRQLLELGVDAVMIHAATFAHTEIASFFLQHGVATFVDKPLADSAADVERLYELSVKYHCPLYVGFNRRHIPLYNDHIPELANGDLGQLTSLRWEKHRFDHAGEIRTFVFDDFIHPLDSINLNRKSDLSDVYVTHQMSGRLLSRLDVQWQAGGALLHASMNRQFGITRERVSASYQNVALEFDSFVGGKKWQQAGEQSLMLKDWTPMLASKGFENMIADWLRVVECGQVASSVIDRNIATHQLAEALTSKLEALL